MCIGDPTRGEDVTQIRNLRLQTTYVGNMEETNETSQAGVRRVYYFLARRPPTRTDAAGHPENRIPCPRDRTTKDRLAMLECRARWHGAESIPVKSEISVVLEWDPDVHLETSRRSDAALRTESSILAQDERWRRA